MLRHYRTLFLFIKSLVSPFVDIALIFFMVDFIYFQQVHVLFEVTFLFKFFSLLSKPVHGIINITFAS